MTQVIFRSTFSGTKTHVCRNSMHRANGLPSVSCIEESRTRITKDAKIVTAMMMRKMDSFQLLQLTVVGVDLQWAWATRDPSLTLRPDRGQSSQLRGSGSHRQRLYNGHVNQRSLPAKKSRTLHRRPDPLWRHSGGMHHCYHALLPLCRCRLRFAFDLQPYGMEPPYTLPKQRLKIRK
jgi:hypothetical protein